jgi:hypothetical protein
MFTKYLLKIITALTLTFYAAGIEVGYLLPPVL